MECIIKPKVGAIIVAGGKGIRMGGTTPKQFRILGQAPVLAHSINAIAEGLTPAEIVVVLPHSHIDFWQNLAARFEVAPHRVVEGGNERYDSVKAGLEALNSDLEIIAVHDGVRPLCSAALLERCLESTIKYGSAIPATPLTDSVRQIEGDGSKALERSTLRAVQTPQCFDATTLRRAYQLFAEGEPTDDASLVEASGQSVNLVEGERANIKITTEEDLLYAQMILESRNESKDI